MRKSGVLLAISSLPGKYGIGSFGKEAYDFVDFLVAAGQHYWQILPLGPTGFGDSPYQSFSTYAGNPYYIDLESLIKEGLLTKKECDSADLCDKVSVPGSRKKTPVLDSVNYEKIYFGKMALLRKAYERFDREDKKYKKFVRDEKSWLADYALFMALKEEEDGASFIGWDKELRTRKKKALSEAKKRLKSEIEFYYFCQYFFFTQWGELKKYANKHGIEIIGDIPIYVAADSADTWANPELFLLDKDLNPTGVAGCPPDYFSATGQLWGNPLYDWEYHKKTGYRWWIDRMQHCFRLYDRVRIDHFRAFDEYYFIPFGDPTAEFGHWEKGPGVELFRKMEEEIGDKPLIAEDLGFLTDSVFELMRACGYPGMKVLEFAFDSMEDNDYLPHNFNRNCVVYTGTHDNDTVLGWYPSLSKKDRKFVKDYLGIRSTKYLNGYMIRLAFASVADTAIVPMQDLLGLGSEARMNIPSTLGINWKWRLKEDQITKGLTSELRSITEIYGRI